MDGGHQGIGASLRRREDLRFVTGRGHYVDDITRPGQLYAHFLRSDQPHARINGIDTAAATAAPGVAAVYTGSDMAALGGIPCGWQIHNKDGSPMAEPKHPVLAQDAVRHVGDPIAMVIADSPEHAEDAAELIALDLEPLRAVASVTDAIAAGAPLVHDSAPGNICYDWQIGDQAAVDAAFSRAAKIVMLELTNNRLVPNAMEPRAALAEFDRASGDYTLYTTSQNPHVIRLLMGAFVLQIPEHKLRVVAPDVGGGFGSKIYHYAEEAAVTWAAGKLGRPVKWTADRIDQALQKDRRLRPAGAAIGVHRHGVGEDADHVGVDRLEAIDARQHLGARHGRDHRREGGIIGAHVGDVAGAQRQEPAILVQRQLDIGDVVAALRVAQERLAALTGPLHRAAELARGVAG